ncbi:MAG: hypothetical protein NC212_01115 [Staphylococcus sp.]|nr:hypothetical protein [Staphylococcus sp.]
MFGQAYVEIPEDAKFDSKLPVKITNNGKVLAKTAYESLYHSDLTMVFVKKDSVFITIKEDVLKRLDKNSANYESPKAATKRSTRKSKGKKTGK